MEGNEDAQLVAAAAMDKLAKKVDRIVEKVEAGEPRFQAILAIRLRMEKKLSIILSMLERQQGQ